MLLDMSGTGLIRGLKDVDGDAGRREAGRDHVVIDCPIESGLHQARTLRISGDDKFAVRSRLDA